MKKDIKIKINNHILNGILTMPENNPGFVIFAHGSGSSRLSPRNAFVSDKLREKGFGTLLFDLLAEDEDLIYENRFDIDLLADRLERVTQWISEKNRDFKIGYFGASTGTAAAIKSSIVINGKISALVSRGGRPDLAAAEISNLKIPTLLIVGGNDPAVIELNKTAFDKISAPKKLEIIPGATHLFEERGALEEVSQLAINWFEKYLVS